MGNPSQLPMMPPPPPPPQMGGPYMPPNALGPNFFFPYNTNATVVDMVPRDMLHMVPDHWYRFPPMNPLWHSLIGLFMVSTGVVSMIGNFMVIYLMSSVKTLRTPTNMLVTNLAFSDFTMMAFMMPTTAAVSSSLQCLRTRSLTSELRRTASLRPGFSDHLCVNCMPW